MASTINGTSTGNGGLISTGDDSGILNIQTNETTAITVDASQNVSVGTTTALITGAGRGNITVNGASDSILSFGIAGANTGWLYSSSSGMELNSVGSKIISFTTNGSERMRITSSGIISQNGNFTSTQGSLALRNPGASVTAGKYHQVGPTGDADPYFVIYNQSAAGVYISPNGTSWNSSSDETVKENLVPITDALSKVNTLRAVIGNYITDETKTPHPFLIAQDVQSVLPQAVNQTPEGKLGLSYTETIPLLVASIKELKQINDTQAETINALTARIVALETA
jgi:hypothetical protein